MAKVITVDADKCYACLGCVVACAYRQAGEEAGPLYTPVLPGALLGVVAVEAEAVPVVCNHCQDSPCMRVCPTKALTQAHAGAPVVLEAERCIGCKACVLACPFGMIQMRVGGRTAAKCDLCQDRLAAGERPACVASCPTGALALVELGEVVAAARKRAALAHVRGTEE